jgi:hypothetical protein
MDGSHPIILTTAEPQNNRSKSGSLIAVRCSLREMNWKLETGNWKLETGNCKLRMANGEWRMANG